MGIYLNPGNKMFMRARNSEIYIDKSGILPILNNRINTEQEYVCVSRPRRFGKSMTANMIAAYYDRTCNAEEDFRGLSVLRDAGWKKQANCYNVIRINMQEFLSRTGSVSEMTDRLQQRVVHELVREYPDVDYYDQGRLSDCLEDIYSQTDVGYVVVIDEWDCIFREYPHDNASQRSYLDFLRDWLKDKSYIALAYMTGILPIKKYGTHSALNIFSEYSMENPAEFSEYVGFTEDEVRSLCRQYPVSFDDCSSWYDGYSFPQCRHVYNPKSIVSVMLSGIFDDYWNRTETYEALKVYIDMNYDGLRDAIIEMMAGARVKINTASFQNDMTTFAGRDDVLTLLIHLGYLGYDFNTREVFIPNREILSEFVTATTVSRWSEIINSVAESDRLLQATWNRDEAAVAAGIEKAHLETSHLQYNDENALSYTVSLAYYAARQYYTIVRELPSGKGFADLAYIPRAKYSADRPAMIIELKWDQSADTAIRQIREKEYDGALKNYQGNLLLVGISYDRKTREHSCRIEKA